MASPETQPEVLCIDDNPEFCQLIDQITQLSGHRLKSCSDPREALELLTQGSEAYYAIFVDHIMPEITGEELAKYIRQMDRLTPIVMISGTQFKPEEFERMRNIGIDKFICKPFDIDEILETLTAVPQIRSQRESSNNNPYWQSYSNVIL